MSENEVIYIESSIDKKKYLVRDLPDKYISANLLAQISKNIDNLTNFLYENRKDGKYKKYKLYIEQLKNKIKDCIYMENGSNSVYTSYSINKGEQIVFCLRSRNNMDELHDLNVIMYVALHEISHVACPEYDHTPLFNEIFAFIAQCAIEQNIYKKIDFATYNTEYCGLILNQSIV